MPRCPTCSQGPVKEQDLIEILRPSSQNSPHQESTGDEKEGPSTSEVFLRRNDFRSSTKLDALVLNLSRCSLAFHSTELSWFQGDFEIKTHSSVLLSFRSLRPSFRLSLWHWTVNACLGIVLMDQWTSRSAMLPYQNSSRTSGSPRFSLSA